VHTKLLWFGSERGKKKLLCTKLLCAFSTHNWFDEEERKLSQNAHHRSGKLVDVASQHL